MQVLLTGLLLSGPAWFNGSPLVFSDSGTYMRYAFDIEPPMDRAVGYSLLIRAVSWRATMWTVVLFQGMVFSWLLLLLVRDLFPRSPSIGRTHFALVLALTTLSSLPWYTAQIMPDVLAGGLGIIPFLLLFGRRKRLATSVLLGLLFCLFTISHFSFMPMVAGLGIVALLLPTALRFSRTPTRRARLGGGVLVVSSVLAFLFHHGFNYHHGRGWVLARTSDLFMVGKLCESGVVTDHLRRTCPERPHPLCAEQHRLTVSAMYQVWEEDSPLRKGYANMEAASDACAPLLRETLLDHRNWPLLIGSSLSATATQLAQYHIGSGIHMYREESAPWHFYSTALRTELPMYMESRQQRNKLSFNGVNMLAPLVLLASLFIIVRYWPGTSPRWKALLILMIATWVLNAAATGALGNVYDRLQARVTWLLPMAAFCLAARRHHWSDRLHDGSVNTASRIAV
ncbi:MAG: hypothetical protein E6Q99_03300 [Elusimicrobia bacterium]|nr:MAG: hypothetical protein E6Q99_03300 [Elusimicrobiota bacterium]